MKKVYLGIFIAIFAIIAMSHNASAITPVIDMGNYDNLNTYLVNSTCEYTDSTSTTGYSCNLPSATPSLQRFHFNQSINVKKGDLVHFYLLFYSNDTTYPSESLILKSLSGYQSPFRVKHFSIYNGDIFGFSPYVGTICYQDNPEDCNTTFDNFGTNISRIYEVVLEASADANNVYVGLRSNTQLFVTTGYSNSDVRLGLQGGFTHYRYLGSSDEQAAENIENQTPPSSSETGDGAQATNLINAFSGFVSALGGLSATNCNLTLNFPSFAGGSRVVNVCQNKDKAGNIISVFSSLTLIVFYVPLAIRLLTMIYNEIRSFTNG